MRIVHHENRHSPRYPYDPQHPDGIDLDQARGTKPACVAKLPYPAEHCGFYQIDCPRCGVKVLVSTAGRADDPRSVTIACKLVRH